MWKSIKPVLAQLLTSKKALAALAAALVWALAQAGIVASPEQILPLLGVLAAYIAGQGLADIGKEAKKVEGETIKELAAKPEPESDPN